MTITCAAGHCRNHNYNNKDLSFHKFPKDESLCAEWTKAVRRTRAYDGPR